MKINLKGNTSQEGTPTPTTPQDIHVVSGNNSINVCGKNLFDKNNAEQIKNWFVESNKVATRSSTTLFFIKCEPSTQYTISKISSTRLQFWCSVEEPAIGVATSSALNNDYAFTGTTKTITTTSDAQSLICYYYNTGSDTKTEQEIRNSIQIEKGTTATTYEEYKGASYPINLGDIELCKIGTYQDSLVKDNGKWYVNKQIGKVVLNGSESWNTSSLSVTGYKGYYINNSQKPNTNDSAVMSNYFKQRPYSDWSGLVQDTFVESSTTGFGFRVEESLASTVDVWKTWLGTHNTTLYYVLATPTYTEITDSTLLSQLETLLKARSYLGQTNISQNNNDLASLLNATALEEME